MWVQALVLILEAFNSQPLMTVLHGPACTLTPAAYSTVKSMPATGENRSSKRENRHYPKNTCFSFAFLLMPAQNPRVLRRYCWWVYPGLSCISMDVAHRGSGVHRSPFRGSSKKGNGVPHLFCFYHNLCPGRLSPFPPESTALSRMSLTLTSTSLWHCDI